MAEDLKVFISWSGSLSKSVAKELMDLLRMASDRITPFMSDLNIESGTRGLSVIADELASTSVGILVVTKDNWQSPWLNYEAGALSKEVEDIETRVIPLLVDLEGPDMASTPLVQFQYRKLDEENVRRVLTELAALCGADPTRTVERVMPRWAEYDERIKAAIAQSHASVQAPPAPTEPELIREILETVREIQRTQPPNLRQGAVSLDKGPEYADEVRRRQDIRLLLDRQGCERFTLGRSTANGLTIRTPVLLPPLTRDEIVRMWGRGSVEFLTTEATDNDTSGVTDSTA